MKALTIIEGQARSAQLAVADPKVVEQRFSGPSEYRSLLFGA